MLRALAFQILALTFVAITSLDAQISTPAASPAAKLEQTVGLTDFKIEYSRPGKNGRVIFGDLVPYNEMWRTGANKNTMLTVNKPVTIGGTELKAGSYAIFTKPMRDKWEIYFYSDTNNWGVPAEWDESKVAAKTTVDAFQISEAMENFTIMFDELKANGANLYILWDKTGVAIPVSVNTDKEATASIERTLKGPSARDYYSAAAYYADSGKDMKQAYEWIKKANEMEPQFWTLRRQSLIEHEMGMKKEALATAKRSLEMAQKAGNMDYVRMNEKSIKEWSM